MDYGLDLDKDSVHLDTLNDTVTQWNFVDTDKVNANFRIIRTNIYRNSGPYNDFSIDSLRLI